MPFTTFLCPDKKKGKRENKKTILVCLLMAVKRSKKDTKTVGSFAIFFSRFFLSSLMLTLSSFVPHSFNFIIIIKKRADCLQTPSGCR